MVITSVILIIIGCVFGIFIIGRCILSKHGNVKSDSKKK